MSKKLRESLRKTIAGVVAIATIVTLSGVAALAPVAQAAVTVVDGDVIKNPNAAGMAQFDVYIAKLVGTKKFKRLVLNPQVFDSYRHLSWSNVKSVDQAAMDSYTTSALVRVDTDPAQKVYGLVPNNDAGSKGWMNVTASQFTTEAGADPDSIYTINSTDAGNYTAVADVTIVNDVKTFLTAGTLPSTTPITGVLSVALASNNPAAGTVVGGQAIADLAHFTFTNGSSSEVKATVLNLKRLGVSADTTLSKVYLYEGESRLTDDAAVSSGVISWNNTAGVFTVAANSSRTIAVKSNIAAVTGQTVGVGINAATDITSNASSVSGSFPLNGNTHSIATATLAAVNFGTTTPDPNTTLDPQESFTAWQNTVTIGTRAVNLRSMNFRVIGSIELKDLKNYKLMVDGAQVGTTVTQADTNGYVLFDLSGSPKKIEAGSRIFKVVVDVIGGSNRNFQVALRQAADTAVTDSEFSSNILVTSASATFSSRESGLQTVAVGSLTITRKSESPTGNIVNNGTGVTLATYEMKALGEKMKVENLRVAVDSSSSSTAVELRNGALFVAGLQVGSNAAIKDINDATAAYTEFSLGSAVIVEPGTPKTLEIRADVYDNDGDNDLAGGQTLIARVAIGSSNVQRMTSAGYIAVPDAIQLGNQLTISTGTLSLAKDQSYGNQTVVVPKTGVLLGKFSLTGGSTEAVNLSTIQATFTAGDAFIATDINNLYVKYGAKSTSIKGTGDVTSQSWSISESLAANTNLAIEVYGDIASTAQDGGGNDTIITNVLVSGTTANSGTAVNTNSNAVLAGQTITASDSGTLTVAKDNGTPMAAIVVAGSTPDAGALKVKLTSANEDVYVKELTFRQNINADDVTIAALSLYKAEGSGSFTQVGTAVAFNSDGANPGYSAWVLTGANRVKVPKDGSSYLLVKPIYVSSQQDSTVSNKTPQIVLTKIVAEGQSTITPTISSDGADGITTTLLANDTTSSTVIINEALTASDTTVTVKTGDAMINLAVGAIVIVGTEQMLVTSITNATTIVVTRGYNSSTAATHAVDDVVYYKGALIASSANTSFIAGNLVLTAIAGDVITIENEPMLVTAVLSNVAGGTNELITVIRDGTVAAHALSSALNDAFEGNAQTVMKTKPTLSLAADTPSGSTTGGSQKVIFKYNVAAANNAEDAGENKVVLTSADVTTTKTGVSVNNVKVYPSEFDQNSTYETACVALSATEWRCAYSTAGATNEVIENTSRTYIARADVGSSSNAANTLDVSIASFGSSSAIGAVTAGDVVWTDAANSKSWVNQAGASYLQPSAPLTLGVSSGTYDNVAPTISTTAGSFLFAEGLTTTDNTLDLDDVITITFTERMDASLIKSTLIPGGSAVTITAGETGDISMAITSGVVTVAGIATTDIDAENGVVAAATYTNTASLNSLGTILTLTITSLDSGTGAIGSAEDFGDVTGLTTTMKDVNANAMADSAVNASGAI